VSTVRARTKRRAPAARGGARARRAAIARVAEEQRASAALPTLPEGWRTFVGRWLESTGCTLKDAARGDWEVELSPGLRRRWRRQRVRLVFDPQRQTLPRGAWFTAPGSGAGRKILEAATEPAMFTQRTALPQVPGAPEDGLASVCRLKHLSWGPPRLGPVRYERRIAFHAVVTRWGGLPWQEPWVVMIGPDGSFVEWANATELPDLRTREGLYQIHDPLTHEEQGAVMDNARGHLQRLLESREEEWRRAVASLRDDELGRLGAFFSSRIEEEEERLRRRGNADESEMEGGDATTLKLEWERRAAEVRQRWEMRTEVRLWGLEEWSWPVAELEQDLRAGAVHLKLTSRVDVARAQPSLPACPGCGEPADLLIRSHSTVVCSRCA